MKVVVAHNRYSSAQPSGENVMVDAEIAQLTAAGVEVVPFIRSSDEIADLPLGRKTLLPVSPIWAPSAQRELAAVLRDTRPDVFHLHNPYPLLSPWVVRTAHAHGVPVVQTIHNYRHVCAAATFLLDGRVCHDCVGHRFPAPAVLHSCYRGSKPQSLIMATALAAHRGDWRHARRGLTPFERGLPEALLRQKLEAAGFVIRRWTPVAFPLTRRLGDALGFSAYNPRFFVWLDEALSRLTHWNLRYHAVSGWQKIRPNDVYVLAQKKAA
jgi:glycosyltransferase involved in cell wall biosynthesis